MKEETDLTPIASEVEKQLGAVQSRADGTQAEQPEGKPLVTELPNDGIEEIPFNPDNEGFGEDYDAQIGDLRVRVHRINNLQLKMELVIDPPVRHKRTQYTLEVNRDAYSSILEQQHLEEIVGLLKEKFPRLFGKLMEIIRRKYDAMDNRNQVAESHGQGSPEYRVARDAESITLEEAELQNYYFSKAFDAIAIIVDENAIEVDLKSLA